MQSFDPASDPSRIRFPSYLNRRGNRRRERLIMLFRKKRVHRDDDNADEVQARIYAMEKEVERCAPKELSEREN